MKTVYQCDFCECVSSSKFEILEHEKDCYKHPKWKSCDSCKYKRWHVFSVISDHEYYCELDGLSDKTKFDVYINKGNCPKWQTNNIKLLRKLKLNKLNNVSLITLEK